MNQSTPRVFVSSTIYDFRDLRSALKIWLEEYGFQVLMSEMNDFRQIPDQNSYLSCLQAIDECDYFILLIGGRVGGWYDKANRVSITQMEYRRAYDRLKEGKLRLLVFVRKEVWDIREDRNALKKHLEVDAELDKELTAQQKEKLVSHPSKFVNDATFITAFVDEVARIPEMKKAVTGGGEYPVGNWVYQFSSFKDIADACRIVLNLSGNLRRKAIIANLKYELAQNLKELLARFGQEVRPAPSWSAHARSCFKGGFSESSQYKGDHLIWLGMFVMLWGNVGKRLKLTAINEAIISGEFLDYNKTNGTHEVGPLQKALMDLEGQVERLRATDTKDLFTWALQLLNTEQYKTNRKNVFTLENAPLVASFAMHDMVDNAVNLSKAVYQALEGDSGMLTSLTTHPSSPIQEEQLEMESEQVSHDDVMKWLKG
jgi:hypothetical protein